MWILKWVPKFRNSDLYGLVFLLISLWMEFFEHTSDESSDLVVWWLGSSFIDLLFLALETWAKSDRISTFKLTEYSNCLMRSEAYCFSFRFSAFTFYFSISFIACSPFLISSYSPMQICNSLMPLWYLASWFLCLYRCLVNMLFTFSFTGGIYSSGMNYFNILITRGMLSSIV